LGGTVLTKRNVLQVSDIGPPWFSSNHWIKIVVATVWGKSGNIAKNKIANEM